MKRLLILVPSILAVAACSGGSDSAGGGADRLQPGQWEMETVITAVEAPGAPPEVQARARTQLNQRRTERECITPERAANPLRDFRQMITRSQPGVNCEATDDTFAGGTIKIGATCRGASGSTAQARVGMEGTYTETTLQATISFNAEIPVPTGGTQAVRTAATLRGRRVGDCPAGAARPGNSL